MSDAICPACAGDNLTDYPVCDGCATVHHFPYRATCLHCVRKHAAGMQQNAMLELIQQMANSYNHEKSSLELASVLYYLRCEAAALLATMEEK